MDDSTTMYTPFPLRPVLEKPAMRFQEDEQWLNIKAIIAAIAVPKPGPSFSESSTPVDEAESSRLLLLPKVVDTADNVYGTFNANANLTLNTNTAEEAEERTIVPLHPTTLLASAALTPVYLILMLLPLLPFWIFAGFLVYAAATSPTHTTLIALAFLLPFNTIGTVAIIRFAMSEREKALRAEDVESCSPVSRRSSGSGMSGTGEKRLWRPSMQFVLHGARREGRRI